MNNKIDSKLMKIEKAKSLDIEPQAGDILLNWKKGKRSQKINNNLDENIIKANRND